MNEAQQNQVIRIWEKTIDVQMHFNDIEMRIRNLFITVLLALVGAIGWVLDKQYTLEFFSFELNFAFLLLFAGMVACYLFLLMDKHWYHRLLKGSVEQAIALDQEYGSDIKALGLTSKISGASPIVGFRSTFPGRLAAMLFMVAPTQDTYSDGGAGKDLKSTGKIELFYYLPIRIIQISLILSLFMGGIKCHDQSILELILK